MHQPNKLKKGDKVVILSTARAISTAEIQLAVENLNNWGLDVIIGKSIGPKEHQYAGSDEFRAKEFQSYLNDSSIKAIFFARGGYGTIRIMDKINFSQFNLHPKWLIGYSDITIIHALVNNYLHIQSIHATMPINFKNNTKSSVNTLQQCLFTDEYSITFEGNKRNRLGIVEGEIIGGNLSILYSLLGTQSGFNPDGKILFIEDVGEYLYHIDRMIIALDKANKLSKIKALIVGGFTDMNDNSIPFGKIAEEIIQEHCAKYDFPIAFHAPFGHVDNNLCLPFGRNCRIQINTKEVSLQFD